MALQASSKVKGITVEIGADTTSFGYALKQLKQEASLIAKDMKNVDSAMKLDSSDVAKAADKLKLLQESASNASRKVDLIKKAIDGLNKEYADKSSKEYTTQLEYLERALESASREQDVANARLKEFKSTAGGASVEVMNLGKMIEAHIVSNGVTFFLSSVKNLIGDIINDIKRLGTQLVNFSVDATKSAAEFSDAIGYSEVVYGEMSDAALDWASSNSESLRISNKTLVQYMNTLGQVFHSQGLEESEALKMTESLMELAADLRAATGKTTDDILPVMQRGFTTSVKNFRQFGVIMTDAEVKAYALANGLAEVSVDETKLAEATAKLHDAQEKAQKAMDEYKEGSVEFEKAEVALTKAEEKYNEVLGGEAETMDASAIITARYLLLMERLANIKGQNNRESGLFNSQLALMQTKLENLRDEIGLKLLPVATDFLTAINDYLSSDEGKATLDKIVEQFKEWADSIKEMVADGRFTEFIANLVENLPKIVETVGEIVKNIIEALPYIAQIADEVLQFFGIKTQNQQIKEAFIEVENQIKQFATNSGTDLDTMVDAIYAYAEENNKDVLDIYQHWKDYQPQISKYINQITTDANGGKTSLETALANMDSSTQTHIESQITFWDRLKAKLQEIKNFFDIDFLEILGIVTNGFFASSSITSWGAAGVMNLFGGRASGGPVSAGQMVRINDDAGHRTEAYIPAQDGYILSGDKVDKMINNTNNSRNFGDFIVNVYPQSSMTADVAEQIGATVYQRLRISGARL